MSNNSQKVIKGISSQTLVTIMIGMLEMVSFSIMSRLLTKQDFGYYAAITAVLVIFTSFAETGIGSAIVQKKEITPNFINNAFSLSLLFGSTIAFILFISSGILSRTIVDSTMVVPLRLMSLTIIFNSVTSINNGLMYRRLQFLRVGYISFFSLFITSIIAIYLAWKGFGYYAIITKAILTSLLIFILSTFFAKGHYRFAYNLDIYKQVFRFSGWLQASVVFRNLAHQADRLLMSSLLSVEALGAYNRPKDFITLISTKINGIFDTALFPVLSNIQDEREKMRNAFLKSFSFLNLFGLFLSISFFLNSELIIRVFFGEKWMALLPVTQILSLIFVFNTNGRLADCFLRSLGFTKQQFFFRVIETISNVLAVFIGSKWGVLGVAVAFVFASSFMRILKICYVTFKIDLSIRKTLKTLISSWRFILIILPVMLILLYIIPHTWTGNILLLVLYLLACLILFFCFPQIVGDFYARSAFYEKTAKIFHLKKREI